MIEDLLEGILQGVFPLDTAHLGVVHQEIEEIREMVDAIHRHHVEILMIEIQRIVGESILLNDCYPNVDHQTDEGATRLLEGEIPQIDVEIHHRESIRQIEREILHPGDTRLLEEGIRLLESTLQIDEAIHQKEEIVRRQKVILLKGDHHLHLEKVIL